jgi:hypothetical protein
MGSWVPSRDCPLTNLDHTQGQDEERKSTHRPLVASGSRDPERYREEGGSRPRLHHNRRHSSIRLLQIQDEARRGDARGYTALESSRSTKDSSLWNGEARCPACYHRESFRPPLRSPGRPSGSVSAIRLPIREKAGPRRMGEIRGRDRRTSGDPSPGLTVLSIHDPLAPRPVRCRRELRSRHEAQPGVWYTEPNAMFR